MLKRAKARIPDAENQKKFNEINSPPLLWSYCVPTFINFVKKEKMELDYTSLGLNFDGKFQDKRLAKRGL
ncbi:MAG: hypothetical protein CFE24_08625 [Flavobacterium sp. BFFFF2]|nr:MAG: hypothetical protein CFE24_08625 [Flavobacterium sp. BFFFF2]